MNPNTARILLAIFLLAHGWVHLSLTWVPVAQPGELRTPFFPAWWRDAVDPQWPISHLGWSAHTVQTIGSVLWVLVGIGYSLACLALIFLPGQAALWQALVGAASVFSLLLLALFWHPWLPVGVLIDLALLAALLVRWPPLFFPR